MIYQSMIEEAAAGRYPQEPTDEQMGPLRAACKDDSVAMEQLDHLIHVHQKTIEDIHRFARLLDATRQAAGFPSSGSEDELYRALHEAASVAHQPTPDGWLFVPVRPDPHMVDRALKKGAGPDFADHYRAALKAIEGTEPERVSAPAIWGESCVTDALRDLAGDEKVSGDIQTAHALQSMAGWMDPIAPTADARRVSEPGIQARYEHEEAKQLESRARKDEAADNALMNLRDALQMNQEIAMEYAEVLEGIRSELGVPAHPLESLEVRLTRAIERKEALANERWVLAPLEADERMVEAARAAGAAEDFTMHYHEAIQATPAMKHYQANAPREWVDANLGALFHDTAFELSQEDPSVGIFADPESAEVLEQMAAWLDASSEQREAA